MGMQQLLDESIIRRNYTITSPFRNQTVCWFREQQIINNSNIPLFLMRRDGSIVEVPSRYPGSKGAQTVVLMYTDCAGITEYSITNRYTSPQRTVTELTFDAELLEYDAIYFPEMDIALSTGAHKERLTYIHPAMTEKQAMEQLQFFKAAVSDAKSTLYFQVNATNPAYKEFFTIINGVVTSWPVTHHDTGDSIVAYMTGYHDGQDTKNVAKITFPPEECFLEAATCGEKDSSYEWFLGLSRSKVQDLYDRQQQREREKYTKKEVQERVFAALEDSKEEIESLKGEISKLTTKLRAADADILLFRTLETKRVERENIQLQQRQAQEAYKQQQEVYRQQQERLQNEAQLAAERHEMDRETFLWRDRAEQKKAEQSYRVNELKVTKEQHSVVASEASLFGTALKTAAIAVPLACSLSVLLPSAAAAAGIGAVASGIGKVMGSLCGGLLSLFA